MIPSLRLPLPWFSSPLGAAQALLAPESLPIHEDGVKLEKVLARGPVKGVPIKAVAKLLRSPCPRCGGTAFVSRPDFLKVRPEGGTKVYE